MQEWKRNNAELPKRPVSAYFEFSNKHRKETLRKYPHLSSAEVSGVLAKKWREAALEVRASYKQREKLRWNEYKAKMSPWRRNNKEVEQAASMPPSEDLSLKPCAALRSSSFENMSTGLDSTTREKPRMPSLALPSPFPGVQDILPGESLAAPQDRLQPTLRSGMNYLQDPFRRPPTLPGVNSTLLPVSMPLLSNLTSLAAFGRHPPFDITANTRPRSSLTSQWRRSLQEQEMRIHLRRSLAQQQVQQREQQELVRLRYLSSSLSPISFPSAAALSSSPSLEELLLLEEMLRQGSVSSNSLP